MSNTIHIIAPRGNTIAITAAGSGKPLVLLHGFPLDFRLWHNQLDGLSRHYQILAIHLRGFGESTLDDQAFQMCDLADDVEFVRRHLASNQRIWLVGLSMGGYIALEYWQRYSEHLSALVLSNTKPEADTLEACRGRLAMADTAIERGTWPAASGMLPKLLAEPTFQSRPEVANLVETMIRDTPPATIAAAQRAMASRHDFSDRLSSIRIPTLVIAGQHDAISPVESNQVWSAKIPHGKLEVIMDTGHLPPLEAPQTYNHILQSFLDTVPQ